MTFISLSQDVQGCLLTVTMLIMILCFYNTIRSLMVVKNKLLIWMSIVLNLITFIVFQLMEMHHVYDYAISFSLSVYVLIPLLAVLMVLSILLQYQLYVWQCDNISAMSVKEAFDSIPAGLYFETGDGLPVLTNDSLKEYSHELTDRPLAGYEAFMRLLGDNDRLDIIRGGDEPIVLTRSGKVYGVIRNDIEIAGKRIREITVSDLSSEYELTRKLEERQKRAGQQNTRLKALLGTIEYVIMNRELLQLKAALHDNIGQSILIARRFLLEPGAVDRQQMLSFWRSNIKHLLNGKPEEWELPYYVIAKEADKLGIRMQIIGQLPDEERYIKAVDSAISVHLGNTLKHTDAASVTIRIEDTEDRYIISFYNEGSVIREEITEKGGLKNLRREIEEVGGSMELASGPETGYIFRAILPREIS
ncbi:MAG: hypothetical protein K6F54_05050 [Lachnospiraceae bacterium]|nr:hypothetical protein [Lachnospiraceae bacterium]